jgi:uncharacterized delta-60 repeat protein
MFTPFAFIKRQVTAAIARVQKVLIAGNFTSFRTISYGNLIKITPTTAIDTTFNMGSGSNNSIFASAIDENGKILIGGNFTSYSGSSQNYITRISTNGTRDTTFNIGSGFNNQVYSILPVSQSKVLVGGLFTTYSGSVYNCLTRINSNGTVDGTFSNPLLNTTVYTVATQSDGKIIVGGDFTVTTYPEPFLAKITPQFDPDTTFNSGAGPSSNVYTFATQSDGKIIMGGNFTSYSGSTSNRIVRLNTDGSIDTSFNIGTQGFNGDIYAVKVQPDSKILVGGNFTTYSGSAAQNRIIRLNSNGTIDATFVKGTGFNSGLVYDLQLQSDGKIIAVGTWTLTYSGSSAIRIARINTSGSLDTTFNSGTTGLGGTPHSAQIQNDGKIIVVGASGTYSGSAAQRIRRINTNGTLDTTFNIGAAGLNGTTYRAIIQPDQKIVVLGAFTSYSGSSVNRITRINTNGTRDTTFNVGTGFDSVTTIPSALELDSSGSIYAGSNFLTYSGSTAYYFVKISPSGSIVTGSGNYNGFTNFVNALLVDSTGSVYAGGAFTGLLSPNPRIVRLNTDGTKDTSFQVGTGFNTTVNSLVVQSDDKIVVGGNFTTYSGSSNNYIVRLDSNGTKDTSFNMGSGSNNEIYKVALQSDNKILVGGEFTTYSGSTQNYITRLNTDGTRDTTFNIGTGANAYALNTISDIKQDQSGNIHYANRGMTFYSGSSVTGYVKLTSNGSIDPTFISTAASASSIPGAYTFETASTGVASISIDSSNNAYLFGNFQNYLNRNTPRVLSLDLTQGNINTPPNFGTGFSGQVTVSTKTSSGDIWLAGAFTTYSGSSIGVLPDNIVKINSQGNLIASISNTSLNIGSLSVQSDEKLLVGFLNNVPEGGPVMYRYNSNGTIDNTFNQDNTYAYTVYAIKQQSTGNILMGGSFTGAISDGDGGSLDVSPFNLTRLNSSGSQIGLNVEPDSYIYNINLLPDDSFIVTGLATSFSGTGSAYIAKLDSTGSIITDYNVGSGFGSVVYTSTLQPDGKLIAAGTFASYSGSTVNTIARINTNGTLDTTFNPGSGFNTFNTPTSKIVVDQENNIHVVGPFTTYSGSTVNGYVKLAPNGTIHPSFTGSLSSSSTIGIYAPNFPSRNATTIETINI